MAVPPSPVSAAAARPGAQAAAQAIAPKLLQREQMCRRVGFSYSKIKILIRAGTFPPPIKFGRAARWVTAEVDAWIDQQIATRDRAR